MQSRNYLQTKKYKFYITLCPRLFPPTIWKDKNHSWIVGYTKPGGGPYPPTWQDRFSGEGMRPKGNGASNSFINMLIKIVLTKDDFISFFPRWLLRASPQFTLVFYLLLPAMLAVSYFTSWLSYKMAKLRATDYSITPQDTDIGSTPLQGPQ